MKTLVRIFVITFFVHFSTYLFAQTIEVIGNTKRVTPVSFGSRNSNKIYLPANIDVYITDSDLNNFTIRYSDGYGYVSRSKIKYNQWEINELEEYRQKDPFDKSKIKPPTIQEKEKIALTSTLDIKKIDDPYKYEIDHIRYCMGRYNSQVMTGYGLSIGGSVLTIASAFIDDSGIGIAAGGVLTLIGSIVIIDGQKWTKRAYVGPNGMGVVFKF